MQRSRWMLIPLIGLVAFVALAQDAAPALRPESPAARDARMAWWREARFGLFIHWGLYSIPAGEWKGATNHAEWIRHTAQIPTAEYVPLVGQFNPVKFDADQWVKYASDAGMRYIVITSKHHDGFCLFDSEYTDFDVLATPFHRDILSELNYACRRSGMQLGFYHSIMDWHHPDYLPRRPWEQRSAEGADFDRYIAHMKNQLRELVAHYGPLGILWFDGEWENTWTHPRGVDLYNYVRELQPDIIINNRVDVGRDGMQGFSAGADFAGDYGTPEQEVPPTGLPGVDWESCITMNDHWGFNKHDHNWKSSTELIRMLVDIVSKGGNLLLNVGPTAEGEFPPEAIERLHAIGQWLQLNGEAIYGTQASPFKSLPWGRCTRKTLPDGATRLYLHVFDWPADGRLVVPGLLNEPRSARLLTTAGSPACNVKRSEDALVVTLPQQSPDPTAAVVALDIVGPPDIGDPPVIAADADIFVDSLAVTISSPQQNVQLRYTTDGTDPTATSPAAPPGPTLSATTTLKARAFRGQQAVSGPSTATFQKVQPLPAVPTPNAQPGLTYEYFEGNWEALPDFSGLGALASGTVTDVSLDPRQRAEHYALRFRGYVTVPRAGVYRFATVSDDGSRLSIGERVLVDNDGPHTMAEVSGVIALAAGTHPLTLLFFERTGDEGLELWYSGPGIEKQRVPAAALTH